MRRTALCTLFALPLVAGPASAQLVPRDGRPPIAVRSHRVDAVVEDGLARTTVRQTFVNPYDRPLEAVYLFPLPDGAALVDVAMEVGGQRLEGLLAERKKARRVYDDIVRSRRDPALVEQVGRNAFRLSVFPVVPQEETVVELSWIQRVPLTEGAFRYVYPLALGRGSTKTEQDFTVTVHMRSAVPFTRVYASRNDVQIVQRGDHEVIASLEQTAALLDRDLVVTGEVATEKADLSVKTYCDRADAGGWFQAVITPPRAREDQLVPRDVILVIDTSGSMQGGKIEQAKESALWLLQHLRPTDRVNVLRFSTDVQAFADAPVSATPDNLAPLEDFVRGFRARGGTALGDVVLAATAVDRVEGRARTIVLLTDGQPTVGEQDPARLVEFAKAGGEKGLRLYPFGVGTDVDGGLLRGMASAGRGRAEIFRPGGEIATRLTSFLTRTSSPVLSDLAFAVDGVAVTDVYPRPLPDAYLGEQVTITGRFLRAGRGEVRVTATMGGEKKTLSTTVDFPGVAGGSPAVAQLFAREKLAYLEEARRIRLGLTDDAYYAALDRGAYSTEGEIVAEMIELSLAHGVQSAYTSFLVLLPEDRHRLDPRDTAAVTAAVERAREAVGIRPRAGDVEEESEEPLEEPVLQDAPLGEYEQAEGDPDLLNDSPFDSDAFNDVIGIGGGAGGKFGGRFGSRGNLRAQGGEGTQEARKRGNHWLALHQDPDGRWDSDDFMKHCPPGVRCTGAGAAEDDVGVTALALLAYLGAGSTTNQGIDKDRISRGIKWLRTQQVPDTGAFGATTHPGHLRDHALATVAMCEAYYFSKSPLLKESAQRAVNWLQTARHAAGGWHDEAGDVAVTGWTIMALASARDAGLTVDAAALAHARTWPDGLGDEDDELTLAVGLLSRFLLGQGPDDHPAMTVWADRLLGVLPAPEAQATHLDPELWFFGTYAMFQTGGRHWKKWNAAMKRTVLGDPRGFDEPHPTAWSPHGPHETPGGRVYSMAIHALCLEVYFRYSKLVGAR